MPSLYRRADQAAMFRLVLMALVSLVALLAAGCAGLFGPRTIDVPEARLQQIVARQFPLKSRVLELFDIDVAAPRLTLLPEANRIASELEFTIGNQLLKTPYQ